MLRFLEMAADAVENTLGQIGAWWGELAISGALSPASWTAATWAYVAAVLLLVVLLVVLTGRRRRRTGGLPEVLLSHGELTLVGGLKRPPAAQVSAPGREKFALGLTISNLESRPVQLLELSVRTRGSRDARVVEASAVVPPRGAVDVTAELFDLPGDSGTIDLYLYASRGARTFRVSAPLEWEPWGERYRIRALTAVTLPAGELPSEERARRERRSFRAERAAERQRDLLEKTLGGAKSLVSRASGAGDSPAHDERAAPSAGRPASHAPALPAEPLPLGDAPGEAAEDADEGAAPPRRKLEFPEEF